MPFNAANPANGAKVRRIGTLIRPNWVAIEQASESDSDDATPANSNKFKYWGLNLFDRTQIPAPTPPADSPKVDNSIVLYSKVDADTSYPELWTRHSNNDITQLTKGPANIAPGAFTSNGETSIYGGLIVKYGISPNLTNGSNTLTWITSFGLTDFPNSCFTINCTPIVSGSKSKNQCYVQQINTTVGFDYFNHFDNADNAKIFVWAIGN